MFACGENKISIDFIFSILNKSTASKNLLRNFLYLERDLLEGTDEFDEYDEGELVSDNAWEESGKFEGDLILNERQRRLIVQNVAEQGLARNGIIDAAKRWPNNEVIFAIQVEHFCKYWKELP